MGIYCQPLKVLNSQGQTLMNEGKCLEPTVQFSGGGFYTTLMNIYKFEMNVYGSSSNFNIIQVENYGQLKSSKIELKSTSCVRWSHQIVTFQAQENEL